MGRTMYSKVGLRCVGCVELAGGFLRGKWGQDYDSLSWHLLILSLRYNSLTFTNICTAHLYPK